MKALNLLGCLLLVLAGCSQQGEEAKSGGQQGGGNEQHAEAKSNTGGGGNTVKLTPSVQEKVGLHVLTLETRSVPVTFSAPGQIVLNEERTAHVGSYADGRVVELTGVIGAYVHRGAVLAKLHSHSVHETRAALESARQEIAKQEESVDYQRRMRDRMQRLIALKSASPQELERTEAQLRSAQTDLQNARIAKQKETVHLADLLGIPEIQIADDKNTSDLSPILAPIDGIVIDRKVSLGTIVEPGQEAFTVSDLATVWMIASVNETDLSKLRVGRAARVTTQAYPEQPFNGHVTFVAPDADPQTRTLQARILLANTGRKLHPGMFANAQITAGAARNALFVPERSLQDVNGGSVVFVQKSPGEYEARPVQIARRLNGEAEIASGLKPGDVVVTDGSFVVKSELLKSQIGQ